MKNRYISILFATILCVQFIFAAEVSTRPRLIVNIVVGSMRASDLNRYESNFAIGGFNRLRIEGVECSAAHYSYQGGATATSLATLATGALPSTHGVVGDVWYDYSRSEMVELTKDDRVRNLHYNLRDYGFSAKNITTQTLTEAIANYLPKSKSATIAIEPNSAIAMNGGKGVVIWLDNRTSEWASSTAFTDSLPDWLQRYNKLWIVENDGWSAMKAADEYKNKVDFGVLSEGYAPIEVSRNISASNRDKIQRLNQIENTPDGNREVLKLAVRAIKEQKMGEDTETDIVNISLDAARNIVNKYGAESIEAEDMYYQLDRDLANFIDEVRDYVTQRDVIFVLTAAGGASPLNIKTDGTVDENAKLFNTEEFAVILNTFLGAKYGQNDWVLGFENHAIYLNHKLILESKLDRETMQKEVAEFALQFRGVSHVMTAAALRDSYFGAGFGAMIQRGFYPLRSGDVLVSLTAGWREEREGQQSQHGSIYLYDTQVPLLIMGAGIVSDEVERPVRVIDIAPTIAKITNITTPSSTEGEAIKEIRYIR